MLSPHPALWWVLSPSLRSPFPMLYPRWNRTTSPSKPCFIYTIREILHIPVLFRAGRDTQSSSGDVQQLHSSPQIKRTGSSKMKITWRKGFKEKTAQPADLKLNKSLTVSLVSPGAPTEQWEQLLQLPDRFGGGFCS